MMTRGLDLFSVILRNHQNREVIRFRRVGIGSIVWLLACLPFLLLAKEINTFYGPIEVTEPVLLELIESDAVQRLKSIHQYGVAYYTNYREDYTRYDHSIGVFAILRRHNAPLKEQVAGLLHDVSHTVFSHVGDWMFGIENQQSDYQSTIQARFLEQRGLGAILRRYGYTVEEMEPTRENFPALECPLPRLCADRIDYNIQGAYHQGFLTYAECQELLDTVRFDQGEWVSDRIDLMKKLTRFSLYMTRNCWGGPTNHLQSRLLADAILRAQEIGVFGDDMIHFGTDEQVWTILKNHDDPLIKERMYYVRNPEEVYATATVCTADTTVKSKFRGIDPLIQTSEGLQTLCSLCPVLDTEYQEVKELVESGWAIKFTSPKIHALIVSQAMQEKE